MYLAITIDTEEDNWGEYTRSSYTVENLHRVPGVQKIFADHGVRPTYLITYPVATSIAGVDILGGYHAAGHCEIGTHLHAWNTPPIEEQPSSLHSFLNHLPSSLQCRKLITLHETITRYFGVSPTSFRSGRWGFSEEVAGHLIRLGYRIDTSISPRLDWSEYGGPDYSNCTPEPFEYRLETGGSLLEVPATVEFVQPPGMFPAATYRTIRRRLPFGGRILAALDRLGALNRVCISPEMDDAPRMIRLTEALLTRGTRIINMFFHSPSLLEGCTPYVRTPLEHRDLLQRIDRFLAFARRAGLRPVTMSELATADLGRSRVKMLRADQPA